MWEKGLDREDVLIKKIGLIKSWELETRLLYGRVLFAVFIVPFFASRRMCIGPQPSVFPYYHGESRLWFCEVLRNMRNEQR